MFQEDLHVPLLLQTHKYKLQHRAEPQTWL